jgi:hypothetical protein
VALTVICKLISSLQPQGSSPTASFSANSMSFLWKWGALLHYTLTPWISGSHTLESCYSFQRTLQGIYFFSFTCQWTVGHSFSILTLVNLLLFWYLSTLCNFCWWKQTVNNRKRTGLKDPSQWTLYNILSLSLFLSLSHGFSSATQSRREGPDLFY